MVLNRSIRTNLAKDGGGVELKGIEGNEVSIHYQGACGSCPTSTSGTLKYIQGQLREQLHPELTVKSVWSNLKIEGKDYLEPFLMVSKGLFELF